MPQCGITSVKTTSVNIARVAPVQNRALSGYVIANRTTGAGLAHGRKTNAPRGRRSALKTITQTAPMTVLEAGDDPRPRSHRDLAEHGLPYLPRHEHEHNKCQAQPVYATRSARAGAGSEQARSPRARSSMKPVARISRCAAHGDERAEREPEHSQDPAAALLRAGWFGEIADRGRDRHRSRARRRQQRRRASAPPMAKATTRLRRDCVLDLKAGVRVFCAEGAR